MGGSSEPETSQESQVIQTIPDEFLGPFNQFADLSQSAANRLKRIGRFKGDFIAGSDPRQIEALGLLEQQARELFPGIGQPAIDLALQTLAGDFLTPEANPFTQSVVDTLTGGFNQAVGRLENAAQQQGAFGGSRQDLLGAQLAEGFNRSLGSILFENFQRERQLQQAAPSLLQAGVGLEQVSPRLLAEVGAAQRQFDQDILDNALLQFQERIAAAQRPLLPLQGFFGTTGLPLNTQSFGTATGPGVTGGQQAGGAISGGLGGAASGALIGSLVPGIGPGFGAGLGGLLGGGGGFFGI